MILNYKKITEYYIQIYRIVFDPEMHFPPIKRCIRIDQNLHGHNAKLKRFDMLGNFSNYIQSVVEEQPSSILKELQKDISNKEVVLQFLQS